MRLPSFLPRPCFLAGAIILGMSSPSFADSISFSLKTDTASASPGDTVVFEGALSNNLGTGEALDAFSFFFDFNNFDTSALSNPIQILPLNGLDFNIPDGNTSGVVELFSVDLLSGAVSGKSYTVDVTLQGVDAKGDTLQGNTLEVAVTAQGITLAPEPATFLLLGSGLLLAVFGKQKLL